MTTLHLSPRGDDRNDGLTPRARPGRRGPLATLAGARDALRRLRSSGRLRGEATVLIQPGRFPLNEVVEFAPEDGDTCYRAVKEGTVVFDGGEELTGFRETLHRGKRAWVLDLPEVAAQHRYFRSLFVNGQRRPRARHPKFSPDAEGVRNVLQIGRLRHPEKRDLFDGDHVFAPKPGDIQNWPSLPDAEVVVLHYWIDTRMGTPRYDAETGWIECARRSVFNLYESFNPKLARYYLDNLGDALSEPGEWYLDRRSGRLTYLPLPGEKLGRTQVVAPRLTRFLRVNGAGYGHGNAPLDPMGHQPVERLRFEGIVFRHADWFQPQAEFLKHDRLGLEDRPLGSASQAASHLPAVIEFRQARECVLDRCTVELTGFYAVAFGPGCRNGAVTRSTMRELGGGGIRIDGSELDGPPSDRTGHIRVEDNAITDLGRVFHQGVGILLMRAFNCVIAHNHIARTCYTGISVGWSWGYRETVTRDNLIERNLIHDIGQGVLSDMGGIYLLGVQPGTVVRGNHIHSVSSADYGGWGIYPDEGSSHLLIEGNWIHDTQGSPLRIHFGRELVVRDNVLARPKQEGLVGIGRVEAHIAANLFNNLLIGPAPLLYEGGYAGDIRAAFRTDANVIAFVRAGVPPCGHPGFRKDVPRKISFKQWQSCGHDRGSWVVPIEFEETDNNFLLPKNSPALKTGFRLFGWSDCGPRKRRVGVR